MQTMRTMLDGKQSSETITNSNHFFKSLPTFPPIEDGDMELQQFLSASDGLKSFVTLLGPTLFSPVIKDMQGNIERLTKCSSNHKTIKSLVLAGMNENDPIYKYEPILALLWLTRAIQFVQSFLTLLLQDYANGMKKENLKQYFQMAYDLSLQKHHNWLVRKMVSVMLSNVPDRKQLMQTVLTGQDESKNVSNLETCESEVFRSIEVHLNRIDLNVNSVHSIFDSVGYDWKN